MKQKIYSIASILLILVWIIIGIVIYPFWGYGTISAHSASYILTPTPFNPAVLRVVEMWLEDATCQLPC